MKKWEVCGVVSGTKYIGTVEAETKEEAEEKAFELDEAFVSLCNQCSRECEDPEIHKVVLEEIK